MSYPNPLDTQILTIGLDGTITSFKQALSEIPWLTKCFHRAYRHYEQSTGSQQRIISVPKTWQAGKEWINNLPNDNQPAQAFFWPTGDENVTEFTPNYDPLMEADIALIVWVNTNKLQGHLTGPSLAQQKADVIAVLKGHDLVTDIVGIVDRSAPEIFEPFTIEDQKSQYTMLPYQGFRINFTVKFTYELCQLVSS